MASITKDKVTEIINNRPDGSTPKSIINGLLARGHELEGFGVQPEVVQPMTRGQEMLSDFKTGLETVGDASFGERAKLAAKGIGGAVSRTFEKTAEGFGDLGSLIGVATSGVDLNDEQKAQIFDDLEVQKKTQEYKDFISKKGSQLGLGASFIAPSATLAAIPKAKGVVRVGLGALAGLEAVTTDKIALEGELPTKGELAAGAVFGGAIPIAGAGLAKGKKFLGKTAPGAIKASGEQFARGEIFKISKISDHNAKKFVDEFGETPATFMQDRAVLGKEPEMVTKLANNWNNLFKAKREGLDLIPGKFTDLPEVDRALSLIKKKIDDIPGVRSTSLIAKDKATINQLSNKIKSEGVTVSEIDEIKRIFERNNKIPSSVDLTVGSKIKALNTEVDGNLRGVVEDLAEKGGMPNIREINKEIRANRRLADLVDGRGIEDGGLTAIDTLLVRYAVVNPKILAGLAISKTATSNVVRRFIAKKLSPKGAKEITPERIGKLIDLEDINLRADLFLESKQLKDAINKGVMKKVTKEQIENALISDDLIKSGVKLGEGFKILPDEKKILDTMTINQKTASLIKKVKGDIREFKLDPQDADKLATKFDKGGFSSLATKLRKYSDDINKGLIDEADNVIKSLTIELDDSAKQLGKRIARVKGLNRLDLPSAINFLEKNKKAPKLLAELKQLDSIFDESFGKMTDISVDEFFTKAVDTINL